VPLLLLFLAERRLTRRMVFRMLLVLALLIVIVYVILLDELVMSSAQRRFGPFNIGVFGLFASIVNGVNLLFVQSFFIMSSYSLVMFSLPLLFLFVLLCLYSISMPLYLLDVYFNFFMFVLASSVLVFVYFLLSYSSFSKYSIIGSFRIITQFLAFGLVFDIILAVFSYHYSHSIFSLSGIFSFSLFYSNPRNAISSVAELYVCFSIPALIFSHLFDCFHAHVVLCCFPHL
jgi:NADH:ubiquinone oxidoreductase subunit H